MGADLSKGTTSRKILLRCTCMMLTYIFCTLLCFNSYFHPWAEVNSHIHWWWISDNSVQRFIWTTAIPYTSIP